MAFKRYIGDGVYVERMNGMLRLTTEYGSNDVTNEIFLEPQVFSALLDYANTPFTAPEVQQPYLQENVTGDVTPGTEEKQ